jgi:hypothetical protein
MKRLFLGLGLTASVLLAGCTSLRKKAEKHYQAGEYLAAATIYEQILADNPRDAGAREQLKRSRQHLVDDRLIEVRELRLAENFNEALIKLRDIQANEREWDVAPSGPAFSTQREEVEELFAWLNKKIREDLKSSMYLRAKLLGDKFSGVFGSGPTAARQAALEKQITQQGAAHCRQMKAFGKGPYARDFVQRYCMIWGQVAGPEPVARPSGLKGFGGIALTGAIEDLPADVLSSLSNSLLNGLKGTPFFDPGGAALKVDLHGKFASSYQEKPITEVHTYNVTIPYEVSVSVPYSEEVPYTSYRTSYDPATGQVRQQPYTEYRTETRYREETETRYRQEPRSMDYPATQFNVSYSLSGSAAAIIDGVSHQLPLDNQYQLTGSYHDYSLAEVGLAAKPKDYPAAIEWLKDRFGKSGYTLGDMVAQAWDQKYCRAPADLSEPAQIETVMKCLRGTRTPHDFVENWFQARFGLSYEVVNRSIGYAESDQQRTKSLPKTKEVI